MKVKCISNLVKDLPKESLLYTREKKIDALLVGKEYLVYAITISDGYFWYYLADEDYVYFPIYSPAVFFEIVDPRLSKYWEIGFKFDKKSGTKYQTIAYSEWVREDYYYDLLSDDNPREVEIFKKYKKLMDEEFS